MHQTTVRFSPDLWAALEVECSRLGISSAHYLREAALARLAYTAGLRGNPDYEEALVEAGAARVPPPEEPARQTRALATVDAATEHVLAATAVSAQSELVWRRAREVRAQAAELRRARREKAP